MRSSLFFLVAVLAAPYVQAQAQDKQERIEEGVRLHNAGDYDGAIAVYESILKDHPHDPTAVYELAFSWLQRGRNLDELARVLETELASGTEQHPQLALALGTVYDDLGEYAKGEAAFRRAVQAMPDKPGVHYNLGVNLKLQKRWADAAAALQEALRRNNDFKDAWFGLGESLEALDQPTRALFAFARGAALEPDSERGRAVASKLWGLLFTGVEEKSSGDSTKVKKEISITLPAGSGAGADAVVDPQTMERTVMSLFAASRFIEKWEDESDAAFFAAALDDLTAAFSGMDPVKDDPYWRLALPWFDAARSKGHLEVLAYALRRSAGDTQAAKWIEQHTKRHKAYEVWKQGSKP